MESNTRKGAALSARARGIPVEARAPYSVWDVRRLEVGHRPLQGFTRDIRS